MIERYDRVIVDYVRSYETEKRLKVKSFIFLQGTAVVVPCDLPYKKGHVRIIRVPS